MSRAETPPRNIRDDQPQPPKLELSPTQLAGGALASVTSAVAASRFGVSGTVMGAAFGSLVSGVAAALYAASLKSATYRIKTTKTLVLRSPVPVDGESEATVDPGDPTAMPPELSGRALNLPGSTETSSVGAPAPTSPAGGGERPRRSIWKPLLLLTVFAFVVSIAAIGVFETAIGHPISNSKDTGTSFGTVVHEVGGGRSDDTSTSTSTSTGTSDSESNSPTSSDTSSSPSAGDQASPGGSDSASPGPTDSPVPSDANPSPTDSAAAGSAAAAPPPTAGAGADTGVVSPGVSG
jgi:hypothetical protein